LGIRLRELVKGLLIVVAWAVIAAAIALPTWYERLTPWKGAQPGQAYLGLREGTAFLKPLDLILLSLLSIFAGALLVDAKRIVLGYFGWLCLFALLMFLGISSPVRVGGVTGVYAEFLQGLAVVLVFRSILFGPLFLGLIGAVVGGAIAEEMHLT